MLRAMQGLSCPACAWTSAPARMTPWRVGMAWLSLARPNNGHRERRASTTITIGRCAQLENLNLETNFAPHFRVIKHSDVGVQPSWEWTTGALEVKLFLVIFSGVLISKHVFRMADIWFGMGWNDLWKNWWGQTHLGYRHHKAKDLLPTPRNISDAQKDIPLRSWVMTCRATPEEIEK